jgi:hypothetical protein
MSDRSSYDLDKLFQKGSERHDFAYNPEAWNAMEQLLDAQKRRRRRWLILLATAGTAVLLLVGWLIFSPLEVTVPRQPTEQPRDVIQRDQAGLTKKSGIEESKMQGAESHRAGHEQAAKDADEAALLTGQRDQQARLGNEQQQSRTAPVQGSIGTAGSDRDGMYSQAPIATDVDSSAKTSPIDVVSSINDDYQSPMTASGKVRPQYAFAQLHTLSSLQVPAMEVYHVPASPSSETGDLTRSGPQQQHFVLGLVAGGESVVTGRQNAGAPGIKAGLYVDYMFAEKFRLSTGLAFTQKDYPAGAEDYSLPDNIFGGHQPPYEADAACQILEIPLALSYSFNGQRRQGTVVQAGLLSYIMVDEHYSFGYENWYPGLVDEWSAPVVSKDWMQVVELSMGYRFGFAGRILEIAPYAQLPIGPVGNGRVKLNSYGVSIHLQVLRF